MGVFEQFPYSNYHDLNLDWILKEIQTYSARLDGYEADLANMQAQLDAFPAEFTEKFTEVIYRILDEEWGDLLPHVSVDNNGQVLTVVNGVWTNADVTAGNLPVMTPADVGKVLKITDAGDYRAGYLSEITGYFNTTDSIPHIVGFLTSSLTWSYTSNSQYRFIILPVKPGDVVSMTARVGRASYYAALRDYAGTASRPELSTVSGWTGRITLPQTTTSDFSHVDLIMPADASYLYIAVHQGANDITPSYISLNGYELTVGGALADGIVSYAEKYSDQSSADAFKVGGPVTKYKWMRGTLGTRGGVGKQPNIVNNTIRCYTDRPVHSEAILTIRCEYGYEFQVLYLDQYGNYAGTTIAYSDKALRVPAGTFFRVIIRATSGEELDPDTIGQHITIGYEDLSNALYTLPVRWCALGDSITQGWYSYFNDGEPDSALDNSYSTWTYKVARKRCWELDNRAVGGSGFIDLSNSNQNAYTIARTIAAESGGFRKYDLVTIAYGINDWKDGNQTLGTINTGELPATPTTVIEAMQLTIETILASNPKCKIIGILPINSAGYSFKIGTYASNYGLGTKVPAETGITLREFCDALAEVYEWYGIQYIDMSITSPVNRQNLTDLLIDGVHPSLDCHDLLAHELADKLTF